MAVSLPKPLSRPRTLLLAAILVAAMVSGGWMIQRATGVVIPPPVRGPVLFDQVRMFVEERYLDSTAGERAYRMAIDGALAELGDPYTVFLPPERLVQLSERTTGNYAGIGLQVDLRDGYIVVVNPLSGSPGERAGIMTGDRIIEIDGKRVQGWTPDEVQRLLRGRPGSRVSITIEHPGSPVPTQLILTRAIIHQSAIRRAALLAGDVGYVALKVFSDSTDEELRKSVDSLIKVGAKSLIIDVRGNPGGLLHQGVQVADLFLNPGQLIVKTRGRVPGADRDYVDSTAELWPKLPVTILVDDKTASASELFAGALQDHDRAALIGTTTYGKGSAQTIYHLGTDGALKLTTARWFTPLGRTISQQADDSDFSFRDNGKPKPRPSYRTDSGRTILGGGGITPDLIVGDTTSPPAENLAFMQAIGRKVGQFRDALTSFAISAKARGSITSADFVVTQSMLDDVYQRMLERNIDVPRPIYDDARSLVSQLLSYEVNRYVFGALAEFYRKAADDKVIVTAQRLMAGVTRQTDLLDRVTQAAKDSSYVALK
jgi:carboxyl-terminal processing protease